MQKQQHNHFIVSLAGANIDTTIVNIEEMQQYCDIRKRMAIVGTEKKTYGELDKMNYQLVGNYVKPKIMAISTKNKGYLTVYTSLLEKYKSGLMIVESDTLSDSISDLICKSDKLEVSDIDILICREGFASMTADEMLKANFLRIHADPDINMMVFQTGIADFYKEKIIGLMISQLFANDQYEEVSSYSEKENDRYSKQGMSDFVDYYQLNKQLSYFVYFDVENNKILNISKETLLAFLIKMNESGMLPIPKDQLPILAETLTIE